MDYEYALLEKQRNRHINCSPGRDHNVDYRRAHSTERSSDDSAALLPTMRCQLQEASLSSVSCRLRGEVKEDAVHHHGRREDNRRAWILFLGPDEIWCCTSTWVDTCARMVGMVVQESISAGSLEVGMDEVGMDEVGKAHGTSVGTLLEVDDRAPCTDGDANADVDAAAASAAEAAEEAAAAAAADVAVAAEAAEEAASAAAVAAAAAAEAEAAAAAAVDVAVASAAAAAADVAAAVASDADVDAEAEAGGETSFLGLKESEIHTDNILHNGESDW